TSTRWTMVSTTLAVWQESPGAAARSITSRAPHGSRWAGHPDRGTVDDLDQQRRAISERALEPQAIQRQRAARRRDADIVEGRRGAAGLGLVGWLVDVIPWLVLAPGVDFGFARCRVRRRALAGRLDGLARPGRLARAIAVAER